jgi:histidinol-phosphate aminotransferase
VGLLDYYRQFQGLSAEEVGKDLRDQANERRAAELARIDPLDLSRTTWPGLPHHFVVNAITFAARRGLHRYVDPHAGALRAELAERHGLRDDQVVIGNGAAQLLASAAAALLEPEDELVTPWPSYPLYPLMARRSHGNAVPVPGYGARAILRAVNERTRLVVVCNPNDPTGEHMRADELEELLSGLPERVVTLIDEALVDYQDIQPHDASFRLLERYPRMLVFRSFSKAWGLAGLRCGYAVGAPDAASLLSQLEPDLGVNDLAQHGALEALRAMEPQVAQRVKMVREQRTRALEALERSPYEVAPSQANVLWLRLPGVDGAELASRLERHQVIVQPGGAIGAPDHVRASVHLPQHVDRLLRALELSAQDGAHAAA